MVASNVAETSVTIEGVVYVVDCCFTKARAAALTPTQPLSLFGFFSCEAESALSLSENHSRTTATALDIRTFRHAG